MLDYLLRSTFLIVARLRWKAYKLFMRISLGRVAGGGLDQNMVYGIVTGRSDPVVDKHVLSFQQISEAVVETIDYPSCFPIAFKRKHAVPDRYFYFLKDVAISTETGAMWIPGKRVLVESLGNIVHFYAWGGLIDVMRNVRRIETVRPVVPCANLGYYHWLLDAMGQVLLARERTDGQAIVAVTRRAHRYVMEGLAFFGIKTDDILECDGPIEVAESILVARNPDLGLIPRDNIRLLRHAIECRLAGLSRPSRKVYISRRKEANRAIMNEQEVESLVKRFGFDVCYFEEMSFEEQMRTISSCAIVMGVHGAGLSNIIAGRPTLHVIEILNPNWFNPCFAQLSRQLGFRYQYMMMTRTPNGVAVDIDGLERLLSTVDK